MNTLLIFCYISDQYLLVNSSEISLYPNHELLFEFDESEMRIAHKILNNLQQERKSQKYKELIAA